MKALIFSDLHIYAHKKNLFGQKRLYDCLDCLDWVLEHAKEHDYIFFLGDLFQERNKIDVLAYQLTFEKIYNFQNKYNKPFYILLGNHDLYFHDLTDKREINTILPFSSINNVKVINSLETLNLEYCEIDLLPFTYNPIPYLKTRNKTKPIFLMSHLAIDGALLHPTVEFYADVLVEHEDKCEKIDSSLFSFYDKVFLGHFHVAQTIKNIEYVGSPLELNFGEAHQDKHIISWNLQTFNQTYIKNDFSPKHLVLNIKELDNIDVSNNFIRVVTDDLSASDLVEIRKKLTEDNVSSLEFKKPKVNIKQDETSIESLKNITNSPEQLLVKYIQSYPSELNKEKLVEIGNKIIIESNNE